MTEVVWLPIDEKPADAADIERAIETIARGAVVRLTLVEGRWRVRALLPAAMCSRGGSALDRDVSDKVAEVLVDHGCEAI